ncbi:MAG: ribosome maturation factor RimM [Coprobacillaceae bacterium]
MERVKIGKIVGTHALKGELKIRSTSDFNEERFQVGNQLTIEYNKELLTLEIITKRIHKGNYLVAFKGYQDINLVEQYIGCFVYANKDEELLNDDEYYIDDIIDCKVYLEDKTYIGDVKEVMDNSRHDVLIIDGPYKKVSIPYVDAFIVEEDIDNKKIIVKVIPGMLNEN